MASVWLLDCTFIPDLFTRHYCVRSYFPFKPRRLSPHPHSIHKCLGDVRGTAQGFSKSLLRQNNWRLLLLSGLRRGARFALCRRRSITRCTAFWLHSGACVELGGWFRTSIWSICLQGRLLLSSLSLLDDPATQSPSPQCHLFSSVGLGLDHRNPLRPLGSPCIA